MPTVNSRLSADILDAITDAILVCANPMDRTEVLVALLAEFHESVAWLHSEAASTELLSLGRVVEAVDAHRDRMSRLPHLDSDRVAS